MRDVLPEVDAWCARGHRVAIATVVAVRHSAPRPLGAKLAVDDRGDVAGAVSGGCVESAVLRAAREVLDGAPGRLLAFGVADDDPWEIGLPCGGEIDVWVDVHEDDELAAAVRAGRSAARLTALDGPRAGSRTCLGEDGAVHGARVDPGVVEAGRGLLGEERCGIVEVAGARWFVDVVVPAPRLVVVGASDLARHVCAVAGTVGWRTVVVDPRTVFARPERFPGAEAVVDAWPGEAFAQLAVGPRDAVVVLTHDPKLDDAALLAALDAGVGFLGAMGSRHAQAARRRRLREAGVDEAALDGIAGPVGLDLGATATPETALSVLAEVVAARHGREGGRLRDAHGRIHELR